MDLLCGTVENRQNGFRQNHDFVSNWILVKWDLVRMDFDRIPICVRKFIVEMGMHFLKWHKIEINSTLTFPEICASHK